MTNIQGTATSARRLETLPDLLTRAELAAFTGISQATFARWAMTGDGPAMTKLGRAARYRKAAVLAWLDRGDEVAAPSRYAGYGRAR